MTRKQIDAMLARLGPEGRVERFIGEVENTPRGLCKEVLHSFHTGDDRETHLLTADLKALVKAARGRGGDVMLILDSYKALRALRRALGGFLSEGQLHRLGKLMDRLEKRLG